MGNFLEICFRRMELEARVERCVRERAGRLEDRRSGEITRCLVDLERHSDAGADRYHLRVTLVLAGGPRLIMMGEGTDALGVLCDAFDRIEECLPEPSTSGSGMRLRRVVPETAAQPPLRRAPAPDH